MGPTGEKKSSYKFSRRKKRREVGKTSQVSDLNTNNRSRIEHKYSWKRDTAFQTKMTVAIVVVEYGSRSDSAVLNAIEQ